MINSIDLKEKIEDAQLVLVGLGEEFECKEMLIKNHRYLQIENELKEHSEYIWILPYIQYLCLKNNEILNNAIKNLAELLKDKNYFIVTTCMNGLVQAGGFKENRVVAPCGGFRKIQCSNGDCDMVCDTPEELYKQIEDYFYERISLKELYFVTCEKCNSKMEFNSLYAETYKEAGYMDMWEIYTKWLQGTLNKKLCVLELGVSLDYPSVIRFPFEKIAFFNQKAEFIRIHEKLYQLSDEIGEKGISHKENAVAFLNSI